MERATFEERLAAAAGGAVRFAREFFVRQPLPDGFALLVVPNCSYDGNPRVGDEEVFPDESLPAGRSHGPWSLPEAVAFLWRAGKVPEWIDLRVVAEDGLRSAGRAAVLRPVQRGRGADVPPARRAGPVPRPQPAPAPRWQGAEVSGRFDLYWEGRAEAEPGAAAGDGS